MVQLFSELLKLPLTVFVSSMEAFAEAVKTVQDTVNSSIDTLAGAPSAVPTSQPAAASIQPKLVSAPTASNATAQPTQLSETPKENSTMAQGQCCEPAPGELRLMRYKILFIKRDYETVLLDNKDELVSTAMDDAAFAAWKTAEFAQQLYADPETIPRDWQKDGKCYPPREYRVPCDPDKLRKYRSLTPEEKASYDDPLPCFEGLPGDDKQYLRVYVETLQTYEREKFNFEEQQIEVLREIRNELKRPASPGEPQTAAKKSG